MRNFLVTLTLAGLGFAACQKSPASTTPPGDASSGTAASTSESGGDSAVATEPGAPGVSWAKKDHKQRMEHMGLVVLPAMKQTFGGYDANAFAKFTCETCHGKSPKDRGYAMPSDSIMPLDKADPVKTAMDYDEKVAKFMLDEVTPQMAKMLDEPMLSADHPDGFGCMRCHPAQ